MPWLLRDGEVLAALEVASDRRERRRGLRGRADFEGALLVRPARTISTIASRSAWDVAWCAPEDDGEYVVVNVCVMSRWRISRPRLRAMCAIEARAGAFERWGLRAGDRLEVR